MKPLADSIEQAFGKDKRVVGWFAAEGQVAAGCGGMWRDGSREIYAGAVSYNDTGI